MIFLGAVFVCLLCAIILNAQVHHYSNLKSDGLLVLKNPFGGGEEDILASLQNVTHYKSLDIQAMAGTGSLVTRVKRKVNPIEQDVAEDGSSGSDKAYRYSQFAFIQGVQQEISLAPDDFEVPAQVTYEPRDEENKQGKPSKPLRPLNARVDRFPHKSNVITSEPSGCGSPVCTIIDSRPMRFPSMCSLVTYMTKDGLVKRLLHVQKGDCADASKNQHYILYWY